MKKNILSVTLVLLMLFVTGTIFAADTCNYYESGTSKIDARITSVKNNTATITVKSFVGSERIEIYEVKVGDETFSYWDITGTTVIGPHGSTTITVTGRSLNSGNTLVVKLKTCE